MNRTSEVEFTDEDEEEWHHLEATAADGIQGVCTARLAQGDLLLRRVPIAERNGERNGLHREVEQFAERVGISASFAKNLRLVAAYLTPERRALLTAADVVVPYAVLREVAQLTNGNTDGEARFQTLLGVLKEVRNTQPRNPRITVTQYRDAVGAPGNSNMEAGVPVARVVRQVTSRPDIVTALIADDTTREQLAAALVEDEGTRQKLAVAYAVTRPEVARAIVKDDPSMAGAIQAEAARRHVPTPAFPTPRTAKATPQAEPEVDPDDRAVDDYIDALPDVQLSRWRAELAGDLAKLSGVLLTPAEDVATKADPELLDRVLDLCDKVTAWGEQIRAAHPQLQNTVDFTKVRRDRVAGSHR